jgi:competence protein ComEC
MRSQWDNRSYHAAALLHVVGEDPQPAIIEAVITSLVQRRPKPLHGARAQDSAWQTRFDVDVQSLRDGDRWVASSGRLTVTINEEARHLRSGDRVRLGGKFSGFSPPTNPGVSDYRTSARNHHQHGRLQVDAVNQVVVTKPAGTSPRRLADQLSRRGEQTLHACLADRTGAIASALVVGRRGSIDPDLQDQLLETGTIHLLSVSGLHMGIVAIALTYVAVLLGMRPVAQVVFVGSLCLVFVALTGARPPVLRAALLVAVVLLARGVNRQDSPLNSLSLASLILMWMNPTNLTQVGVQLSFISVATLFSCGQRYRAIDEELRAESQLDRLAESVWSPLRRRFAHAIGWLKNGLWFSLCVTMTTAPLVWMHFHIVSPVAVLANVLLAVPMTIALISGLVAVILGWISFTLAIPAGWICYGALWIMQSVIEFTAELPGGHFWLPSPPALWVAVYYLALIAGFALPTARWRQLAFVIGSLLWCGIALWLATSPSRQHVDHLQATFINVGHGTSVIINTPEGRNLLYDCGWLGNDYYSARGIQEPLWAMGLTRLDAITLSHADADHYNALPGLLRRFSVGEIVVPLGMLDNPKRGLIPIRTAIAKAGVNVREVSREDHYLDNDRAIAILHPPAAGVVGNENANSLVLRFDHAGRSLILPGDLEPPGLGVVLDSPRPSPGGVLMAPHHGSLTVDSRPILDWARPREVIVSGSRRTKRPEVEEMLRARGSGVHITARHGAIRATLSGDGIRIEHWRTNPW